MVRCVIASRVPTVDAWHFVMMQHIDMVQYIILLPRYLQLMHRISLILGILTQTAKKKVILLPFCFKLKLRWAHCAPLKANRVKRHRGPVYLDILEISRHILSCINDKSWRALMTRRRCLIYVATIQNDVAFQTFQMKLKRNRLGVVFWAAIFCKSN